MPCYGIVGNEAEDTLRRRALRPFLAREGRERNDDERSDRYRYQACTQLCSPV